MSNLLKRWGQLVMLAALVALAFVQGSQAHDTQQKLDELKHGQVSESCAAVKLSDDAISQWAHRTLALGKDAHDAASLAFLDDLDQSLAAAEAVCLRDGRSVPIVMPSTTSSSPKSSSSIPSK